MCFEVGLIDGRGVTARLYNLDLLITLLGENPRLFGGEKLSDHLDRYRVREGNYRILYSIDDEKLLVDVVKVGHRKDVYR